MDLAEFLLARIAKDAQLARDSLAAGIERNGEVAEWMELQYDHTALSISPARVLAECEAKRRIVEDLRAGDPGNRWANEAWRQAESDVLRLLAAPYADHPDYRQEWKL